MDALAFELKKRCHAGRDGAYGTQVERERLLAQMAGQLKDGGFKLPGAASLKPKHVEFLVGRWKADGITDRTIKNRMGALRWWAERVNKASVIGPTSGGFVRVMSVVRKRKSGDMSAGMRRHLSLGFSR